GRPRGSRRPRDARSSWTAARPSSTGGSAETLLLDVERRRGARTWRRPARAIPSYFLQFSALQSAPSLHGLPSGVHFFISSFLSAARTGAATIEAPPTASANAKTTDFRLMNSASCVRQLNAGDSWTP